MLVSYAVWTALCPEKTVTWRLRVDREVPGGHGDLERGWGRKGNSSPVRRDSAPCPSEVTVL